MVAEVMVTVGMAAARAAVMAALCITYRWRASRRKRKRSHSTPPSRDDDGVEERRYHGDRQLARRLIAACRHQQRLCALDVALCHFAGGRGTRCLTRGRGRAGNAPRPSTAAALCNISSPSANGSVPPPLGSASGGSGGNGARGGGAGGGSQPRAASPKPSSCSAAANASSDALPIDASAAPSLPTAAS